MMILLVFLTLKGCWQSFYLCAPVPKTKLTKVIPPPWTIVVQGSSAEWRRLENLSFLINQTNRPVRKMKPTVFSFFYFQDLCNAVFFWTMLDACHSSADSQTTFWPGFGLFEWQKKSHDPLSSSCGRMMMEGERKSQLHSWLENMKASFCT